MKTNIGLVKHVEDVLKLNTVYMLSGIGRPLTNDAITRRIQMGDTSAKQMESYLRRSVGAYCYDCVGLIKNYLWTDFAGDKNVRYNTPAGSDQNVRMMYAAAKKKGRGQHPDVPGILVMTEDEGHVGVYVGMQGGKRAYVEATITAGHWKVVKSYGYTGKIAWTKWAEYPYITYVANVPAPAPSQPSTKTTQQLADEVILGIHGNGEARKKSLGSRYQEVQNRVDEIRGNKTPVAPAPKPVPPTASTWNATAETGHAFTVTNEGGVWTRNNPVLADRSGMVIANKGQVHEYTAFTINDGYNWIRLTNGKWLPWRKTDNSERYGYIEKLAPKAKLNQYGQNIWPGTNVSIKWIYTNSAATSGKSPYYTDVKVVEVLANAKAPYKLERAGKVVGWGSPYNTK